MHGFHREKNTEFSNRRPDGRGYALAREDERYTRLVEGSVYNIEDRASENERY
jgi:hypothetical protein